MQQKNSSITSSSIRESRWTEFALHRDARHRAERVALIGEGSAQAFQPHRAEQRQRESPHSLQSSQQSPAGISLYALGSVLLWPEHLLALNLVVGDCLLAIVRNEPVDELLAKLLLHMRMLGRVYQYGVIWLNSSLSPSTAMTRSDLFLSESHVPRSDST